MAITNYWEGHTVESAKKERERLKKKYNPKGAPRKAENLDAMSSEDIDRLEEKVKKMKDAAP